jgi:hypothetical protein
MGENAPANRGEAGRLPVYRRRKTEILEYRVQKFTQKTLTEILSLKNQIIRGSLKVICRPTHTAAMMSSSGNPALPR